MPDTRTVTFNGKDFALKIEGIDRIPAVVLHMCYAMSGTDIGRDPARGSNFTPGSTPTLLSIRSRMCGIDAKRP
eukprot:592761-Rhodomonas_salina.3